MKIFCNIVFPTPLHQEFTYFLSDNIIKQYVENGSMESLIGCRAIVDFGRQKNVVGVIVDVRKETDYNKDIKPLKSIIDTKPLFSFEQIEFARRLAEKYFVSLGIVLNQFFPYEEKIKFEQSIIVSQKVKKIEINVEDKYVKLYKDKKLLVFNNINEKILFYKNVIFDIINQNKYLIILFPSNVYIKDFLQILFKNIDEKTVMWIKSKIMSYTGEQPIKERYKVWQLFRNKQINVVLATRIGSFLPFENVTNIIIDEPDSLGYKNQEVPMYHAPDIIEERIKKYKILLTYCSFVPSVEFVFKNKKNIEYIKNDEKQISIKIVKSQLKNIIIENIYKFRQTIVIFPYKGYVRFLVCTICKHKVPIKKVLLERFVCPKCGSKYYELIGTGIQKFVQKLFYINKNLSIKYIDSTLSSTKIEKVITDFNNEKFDVLVSTPVLFNYIYRINFNNVKSIYFAFLDNLLYSSSYLSYENVFKLITLCKILLNSYNVENGEIYLEIFHDNEYNNILLSDLKTFYKKELKIRKELGFPPFCEIVKITFVSKDENKLKKLVSLIMEQQTNSIFLTKDIISEKGMFKNEIFIKAKKNLTSQLKQIKSLVFQYINITSDKIYIEYNPVL